MSRIQSNIGLITGVPIGDTVDKLMAIAARPRDLLKTRTDTFKQEQTALTSLTAMLLAVKYVGDNLGKDELYAKREVTSSDPAALAATVTGQPPKGTYLFTPLRRAQSQQWLGAGWASSQDALGGGTLSLRFGDHVERDARLDLLGATGFSRGKVRITDRSGAAAEIDLSAAQTLDDVLAAINANATINVTAVVAGDRIRLLDNTGQTAANLKVEEVGGATAAALGLAGINVAAATADGAVLFRLSADTPLAALNDGRGTVFDTVLADIAYTLRDGTSGTIDLSPIVPNSSQVDRELTLGAALDRINAAAPGKLKAEIDSDGQRLRVSDLTQGGGTFALAALNDSQALQTLGLDDAPSGGTVAGRRILAGTKTVLLSSLNGGQGTGTLGLLQLADRSGASATVDLAAAETLADVIATINAAGIGVQARVNPARNGIELDDTTGSQAGNLVAASGDAAQTAEKLGIAVAAPQDSVNSGDLHLQIVHENTRLAALNGGAGVARGALTIQDTTGRRATLDLRSDSIQTVGDVIRAINRLVLGVTAEINPTGDGIRLRDTAGGATQLAVFEGGATAARDLGLLRAAAATQIGGQTVQAIDGTLTRSISLSATETLDDLRKKINALGMGVAATIVADGSTRPYRLALSSERTGRAGELVVASTIHGLDLSATAAGQDALLLYGDSSAVATGLLATSSSNTFENVLDGVRLEVKQASGKTVSVSVATSTANFTASVKTMVENYNKFRDKLAELTAFDTQSNKRSLLTGDATALRLDMDLSRLFSGRFTSDGAIQSLGQLGVSLTDDGKLELDETRLKEAYADNPEAVQRFFAAADTGFSARLGKLLEQAAGEDGSLLARRLEAVQNKVRQNEQRLADMQKSLDKQRTRLLMQFYNMELAIAKLKDNLTALDSVKPLSLYSTGSQSSG